MSRRGTSCRSNKTANTEINMEEKEVQPPLEGEVEAINIEENQPDKPAYMENISIQEMIRLMMEELKDNSKKMEDNSKKMEELKSDSKQSKEQLNQKIEESKK